MRVYRMHFGRSLRLAIVICFIFLLRYFALYGSNIEFIESNLVNYSSQKHLPPVNSVAISAEFFNYLVRHLTESPFPGVNYYTQYTAARLNLKTFTNQQPLQPEFGPVWNDVTNIHYIIDIAGCQLEETTVKSKSPSLFVAVISAPTNQAKRQSIRETWLSNIRNKPEFTIVGFAFILGLPHTEEQYFDEEQQRRIEEESTQYGDILQIDMVDSYHNLSVKVTRMLNWLNFNCQTVDYVLKVDDDVYVNTRNLASVLHTISSPKNEGARIYGTHLNNTLTPLRGTIHFLYVFNNIFKILESFRWKMGPKLHDLAVGDVPGILNRSWSFNDGQCYQSFIGCCTVNACSGVG